MGMGSPYFVVIQIWRTLSFQVKIFQRDPLLRAGPSFFFKFVGPLSVIVERTDSDLFDELCSRFLNYQEIRTAHTHLKREMVPLVDSYSWIGEQTNRATANSVKASKYSFLPNSKMLIFT